MKSRMVNLFFIFIIVFLLIGVGLSSARVVSFYIKPKNPVKGNVVTIYGTASPNEDVKVSVSFEKVVSVQNGEFVFSVKNIVIPNGKSRFTVTAYGCVDLDVSARRKLIGSLYTPWITLSKGAVNGVASISQSVPPGTYDVIIHGDSKQSSVRLRITATSYIKADKDGKFSYSYDTSSIPPGKFVVSAGGLTKTVTLAESTGSLPSSSPPSSGSSSAPITTPTSTPSSTSTPAPTATKATVRPSTPKITPTPAPVQTPNGQMSKRVSQNRKETSIHIPGFKLSIAIVCFVLAFVYKKI